MNTGPRYARRVDSNHSELRDVIKDCAKAYPEMNIKYMDTSNLGGKVGDLIIQFWRIGRFRKFETHLLEFKSGKKKKLTDSQRDNPLQLIRIDERADIFDLLNQVDWELVWVAIHAIRANTPMGHTVATTVNVYSSPKMDY